MQWMSARTQNACLAAIELARRSASPEPIGLKTIANAQQISSQFLVQILSQLKRAGLVRSIRGASGGYRLAKSPDQISLLDVIIAMDGDPNPKDTNRSTPTARAVTEIWSEMLEENQRKLSNISLAQLVEKTSAEVTEMYYI